MFKITNQSKIILEKQNEKGAIDGMLDWIDLEEGRGHSYDPVFVWVFSQFFNQPIPSPRVILRPPSTTERRYRFNISPKGFGDRPWWIKSSTSSAIWTLTQKSMKIFTTARSPAASSPSFPPLSCCFSSSPS